MSDEHDHSGESESCGLKGRAIPGPRFDGGRLILHHTEDHETKPAILLDVKEGQDVSGRQIVQATELPDGTLDIKEIYDGRGSGGRPAMVNSSGYRDGWDRIFGSREPN